MRRMKGYQALAMMAGIVGAAGMDPFHPPMQKEKTKKHRHEFTEEEMVELRAIKGKHARRRKAEEFNARHDARVAAEAQCPMIKSEK